MKSQDVKVVDGGALAAVDTTTSVHEGIIDQQSIKPKVYKRRFIGMAMLFALNLCSSMAWIDMASVVDFAAKHFSTSTSAINWFSTSFLFVALAANWPASRTTRKSVKLSMIISSAIMIAGTWVMYGGTHTKSFGLSLFGHCIIAVSQPFVLILPALLSEAWFESGSRATATAVSSIANILGSTVGQFIMTAWVKSEEDSLCHQSRQPRQNWSWHMNERFRNGRNYKCYLHGSSSTWLQFLLGCSRESLMLCRSSSSRCAYPMDSLPASAPLQYVSLLFRGSLPRSLCAELPIYTDAISGPDCSRVCSRNNLSTGAGASNRHHVGNGAAIWRRIDHWRRIHDRQERGPSTRYLSPDCPGIILRAVHCVSGTLGSAQICPTQQNTC
ncbi:Uncharacterized protein HZ326_26863 [Fusarium oxysporum f. sp. albedinis]|nr:Uncharacterized protein HZ326_26863 [Fusarium oxysporum f. sp. albedinis]